MATEILMPALSPTMEEGTLAKWLVKEGDTVSSGDIIAEIETDKATMDVEVFDGGTILKIVPGEGDAVPLGGLIAIIGDAGEDISSLLTDESTPASTPVEDAPAKEEVSETVATSNEITTTDTDGRLKVSPLAKRIAADKGIDLKTVHGSGPEGRIVKKDVETFQPSGGLTKPTATTSPKSSTVVRSFESLESKEIKSKNFTKQIAFNIIPHIDDFSEDGYTKEELKMTNETKKILDARIELSATCVRIPVLVSHSESVNIEFEQEFSLDKIKQVLNDSPGCSVIDKKENGGYATPIEAAGKNETFISRIREDKTKKNSLNLWIVSDNLLRGAALNSVEIAEAIINNN